MRVRFSEVFTSNAGGSVAAKVPVVIGGVRIEAGMEFGCRVRLGRVHFAAVRGRDLEVEQQAGVTYVLRAYVPPHRPDRPLPRPVVLRADGIPIEA